MNEQLTLFEESTPLRGDSELLLCNSNAQNGTALSKASENQLNIGRSTIIEDLTMSSMNMPSAKWPEITINPYQGCGFGCSYCYAAGFIPDAAQKIAWGEWVKVKLRVRGQFKKDRRWRGQLIRIGTATDPYQPAELRYRLTRTILTDLAEDPYGQPKVIIMTRSPLVVQDIPLFQQFKNLVVRISVTTDSEEMRKKFEPHCASIAKRLQAITALQAAGIQVGVHLCPLLLPLANLNAFADALKQLKLSHYYIDGFNYSKREFGGTTRTPALPLLKGIGWTEATYKTEFEKVAPQLAALLGPSNPPKWAIDPF